LREEDVAAVYHFNSKVERLQDFSASRDLSPLTFELRPTGSTVLNDAILRAARDLSVRPEKRRAIIVISDGADTRSTASSEKALNGALSANATVYTVDMMDPQAAASEKLAAASALKNLANKSGGRYVSAPGGKTLNEALTNIVEEMSNQYTLGYRPSNPARDGRWRAIDLKLVRTELKVRTRNGYRAPKS
ncbi:MAG: VWA domain-containing protein, partial [Acidobacteria bacterium]|nr:VWA domain-containing protein [Acidobacteriota bacterium]